MDSRARMLGSVHRRLRAILALSLTSDTNVSQSCGIPIYTENINALCRPTETDTPSASESEQTELHYEHPDDSQYPPPTFIDFASGDLCPPFLPTHPSPISFSCQWLDGHHDGPYALATTLDDYVQFRQGRSALDTREHAALVQSQLTFGLLEAVLRVKIPASFLLTRTLADGPTKAKLSTVNLNVLCRDLYHRFRVKHHPDKCRDWLKGIQVTLSEAHRRLREYYLDPSFNPFLAVGLYQEASEDILAVACIIGHSLHVALNSVSTRCDRHGAFAIAQFSHLPDMPRARDQLRAQGWCPLTITTLDTYGFVMLEYARSFRPLLRYTGEHSGCTDLACTVNYIDPTAYVQRHSSEGCDCASAIPPLDLVESLLSSVRIPVITYSPLLAELALSEVDEVPYVAISHVWIDGLGSTTEQGLPACQVARIASMASSLVPGGAFWIDSLCIPSRRHLRRQAIQLLAKTFTEASAVLVIDAGIQSQSSRLATLEEKLLRICASEWMQRLWTYQEAMLARRLYFQFADELVDIDDLLYHGGNPITTPLSFYLRSIRRRGLEGSFVPGESLRVTMSQVAHALRWRMSSRLEEETLAIAPILQIDVRELLKFSSPCERMKSLLLQKQRVAPIIIFHSAPKILGIPGFSWAPRSFMTGPHQGDWSGEESAVCTPTGLLAEYASLVFSDLVELDEEMRYVIRGTTRPACSFLLRPMELVRDIRREFCNAILIAGKSHHDGAVRSSRVCVGVRMDDAEEGTVGEREREVCHYQEILFDILTIDDSEASRMGHSGIPVIDAKRYDTMKVRVM